LQQAKIIFVEKITINWRPIKR